MYFNRVVSKRDVADDARRVRDSLMLAADQLSDVSDDASSYASSDNKGHEAPAQEAVSDLPLADVKFADARAHVAETQASALAAAAHAHASAP